MCWHTKLREWTLNLLNMSMLACRQPHRASRMAVVLFLLTFFGWIQSNLISAHPWCTHTIGPLLRMSRSGHTVLDWHLLPSPVSGTTYYLQSVVDHFSQVSLSYSRSRQNKWKGSETTYAQSAITEKTNVSILGCLMFLFVDGLWLRSLLLWRSKISFLSWTRCLMYYPWSNTLPSVNKPTIK